MTRHVCNVVSGCAAEHILSWYPSSEIGMVVVGRSSGIKVPWGARPSAGLTLALICVGAAELVV